MMSFAHGVQHFLYNIKTFVLPPGQKNYDEADEDCKCGEKKNQLI